MFLLAFAGGRWLGSFAISGLPSSERPIADAPEDAAFLDAEEAERVDNATGEPVRRAIIAAPGNHVCEGCDAGVTRDRQMAEQLGLPYLDEIASADMPATGEEAAAPPQPLASQPVVRATLPPAPPILAVSPTP